MSFLKAMYGDGGEEGKRLGVRLSAEGGPELFSTYMWDGMYRGNVKGLLTFGMNGVCIGPDSNKNIDALKKAEFLVVCDIYLV